jgi:hypothetical protein
MVSILRSGDANSRELVKMGLFIDFAGVDKNSLAKPVHD